MTDIYSIPTDVPIPSQMSRDVKFISNQYGAADNFFNSVMKDTWVGQAYLSNRMMAETIQQMGPMQDDLDYNPMADPANQGYLHISDFVDSRSSTESAYIRKMIDKNDLLSLELDVGGAGASRFLSQLVDPLTYTPVPLVKGIGFIKGATKSMPAVAGSVAASEYLRQSYDPTVTPEETMFTVGAGALIGGAVGGLAGAWGSKTRFKSNDEAGHLYDDLFNANEKPVKPAVVRTEDEIIVSANDAFSGLGVRFSVDSLGGPLAVTSKAGDSVTVDIAAIKQDYADGMGYVLGTKPAKTSQQKGVVFETINVDKLRQWFKDNGGAEKYVEFVIEHEKAHVKLNHANRYPRKSDGSTDLMNPKAIEFEREANDMAFREIGANPKKLKRVDVPENLIKERDAASNRLSQREAEIAQLSEKAKVIRQEAADLREKAAAHETKGVQTRWNNQAARLENRASELDEKILSNEQYIRGFKDDLQAAEQKIFDIEDAGDMDSLTLKSAGGLEKISTSQLPWYRLINNKFTKAFPEVGTEFARLAHAIAGAPALVTKGAVEGEAVPVSVEMLSKQWHGRYRDAMDTTNKAYMKYLKGVDATRGQVVWEKLKQSVPFTDNVPEGKLSFTEFRKGISRSLMNDDIPVDPAMDEAVKAWRNLFNEFEKAGKETGVFQGIQKAQKEVDKAGLEVENLKANGAPRQQVLDAEVRLTAAQEKLEVVRNLDVAPESFFHRMIRQDKLEDPVLRKKLEDVLRAHYFKKPYHYINGKRMDFSTHPDHVEARVRETIAEMYREAAFNDSLGVIKRGNKAERYQKRIDSLQKELKTAYDKEKGILKHQIEILRGRLQKAAGEGSGGPSPVLTRKLDVPTKDIAFILEEDIELVGQHYVMKMAPVVEMARKFGDFRMESEISRLTQQLDELIKSNPSQAKLIKEEKETLIQATEDLRDKVLGVYGIPENPDALHNRAIRFLKSYNVLTLMGKAWMAALADSGKVVMAEGFGNTFGGLIKSATDRLEKGPKSDWFIGGKEVEAAGEALDIAMATRLYQMTEMGGSYHGMTKMERWMQQQQGPFFFANLLSAWTDNIKRFAGSMAQSRMIEDSIAWGQGKLSKERMEALAAIGINEQWAKRFTRQWEEAGSTKGDHLFLANTSEWTDHDAVMHFRAMLATEVNNAVITPGAADKFNFISTPVGSMLMQYRGFGLSATQRIMMSGLQKRDMSTLAGAASMIGIAYMVDYARRPDYAEMDMKDMMFRAVERSGVVGIFSDINGAMEVASGGQLGLRPMMGIKQIVQDPNWAQRTGAVAGPVSSQWLQLVHAMSDPSATESEQARAIRYMIPYNNLWFWSDTFTRAQRTLQEQLEE